MSWMRQAYGLEAKRAQSWRNSSDLDWGSAGNLDWISTVNLHAFHYSHMTPRVDIQGLHKLLEEIEKRRSLDSIAGEIQDGLQRGISNEYGLLLETHPKV